MFVSIIIPAHGENDLLNECISKIRESTYGDYEIIVVDDSSNPPLTVNDPNVKVIVSRNNMGPAGARNLGSNEAKGDILLFVDSDVMLLKKAYHQIVETFETSTFDAVYGIYSLDVPHTDFWSTYKNLYWNFNQIRLDSRSYSICTAIFAIRRGVFNEIGGFDPGSFLGEDREIGLKLGQKKKKVLQNKELQGRHCKKFDFPKLLKHHFQNSVTLTLLLLKTRGSLPQQDDTFGAQKTQVIGILLSPTIVFFTLLMLLTANPVFLLLDTIALGFLLYLTSDFLRYSYKLYGLKFCFFAFFMYLLEEIIAAIGICLGIFRFYILRRTNLDFKL